MLTLARSGLRGWQKRTMATVQRVITAKCKTGDAVRTIDTPSLLVEMNALEYNLAKMAQTLEAFPHLKLRPHAKAHKTAYLTELQLQSGAIGVCCQKLDEVAAIAAAPSIRDVLLTNEVVGQAKLERLFVLLKQHPHLELSVLVDDLSNLAALDTLCQHHDQKLGVFVEVNVGQNRCGVEAGSGILVELAKRASASDHLIFKGLQCYQGALQHVRNYKDKAAAVTEVVRLSTVSKTAVEAAGISCPVITGCGTGTYLIEAGLGLHTECQPGSYVFMDVDYSKNYDEHGQHFATFNNSLFVLTTIMSRAAEGRLVVDAGMKAVSLDSGPPRVAVWSRDNRCHILPADEAVYVCGGDEHGVLEISSDSVLRQAKVGDTVLLVPGHCDPTTNLHDFMVFYRNTMVEHVEAINGRGPGY